MLSNALRFPRWSARSGKRGSSLEDLAAAVSGQLTASADHRDLPSGDVKPADTDLRGVLRRGSGTEFGGTEMLFSRNLAP